MKTFIKPMNKILFTVIMVMGGCFCSSFAADLKMFSNAILLDDLSNDGDSFLVKANKKTFRLRLYFVDCPEISISFKGDARRVREQRRYFGLSSPTRIIHFGNEAKTFVNRELARPFTVYTAFANALGRSSKGRVYGFISTANGNDLATLLVKKGLARSYGMGRKTADGMSRDEMAKKLKDIEISAMLKHIGVWSESDPDKIAELRLEQRAEDRELKELQKQVKKGTYSRKLIDINAADKKELQSVKGIGAVLSERIISGRPYKTLDDLLKIKGIGLKKLKNIRLYFIIGKQ